MLMRLLLIAAIIVRTVPAQCADPVSPLPIPPLLARESILRVRAIPGRRPPARPLFSRLPADSSRFRVRLIDDDAGFAHVGSDLDSEMAPDEESESPDESLPHLPAPDVPPISPESLPAEPVPIDGAASQAEQGSEQQETVPATNRSSFGWIAGTGNQLGMLEWTSRDLAVLDYSAADRAAFRIAGGHAFRWLTGPDVTDLPPYLFSLFVDVGAGIKAGDEWALDVIVSPSWNTDFANKSHQLFRLPWQAVNTIKLDDEWKLVLGITDLDREDIRLLPVAGVIYKPLDGSKQFDLVFPRPKAAWRLSHSDEGRLWGFIAGELGGNSFSIQRPNAVHDIVTLRDYRLLAGWEFRGQKRHTSRFEVGWVFGRAVEYASGLGDYNPGQTAIIRLSSDF